MLGSTVTRYFSQQKIKVAEANRLGNAVIPSNKAIKFDCEHDNTQELLGSGAYEYVLNCTGVIKQVMNGTLEDSIRAISVNSNFPFLLSQAALRENVKVISIATDCVFSGIRGLYSEVDIHDPIDIYGKSKSLGEVSSEADMTLRCSIIGKETSTKRSLLEWVINQPSKASIDGFSNHNWNGLTTLHFAKIVHGIINENFHNPSLSHVVPSDIVSKDLLVRKIATTFRRSDINVRSLKASTDVDRSLMTVNPASNSELWKIAGYNRPPTIDNMLVEYVNWIEGNRND